MGILLLSGIFMNMGEGTKAVRYHQHMEQPDESQLGKCSLEHGSEELCTHLPIISIETGGQKIPGTPIVLEDGISVGYETSEEGSEEILTSFSVIDEAGVWHHMTDKPSVEASAFFRIRGNSSRRFSKKNYRIRLVDENNPEMEINLPLMGITSGSEWALHGPFLDKTLIRNYMWMNLSAEIMGYAPNVRFFEMILDGEYQGVYVLMETIREGEGRVDLRNYKQGDPMFSYLVRLEPKTNPYKVIDNFTFYTERLEEDTKLELIYPGISNQTEIVKQYVKTDINDIERRLFSRKISDDPDSIWEYLDIYSFADYYILQEFLAINDMFSASTYFYKDVRGKLHIGPAWDYNNSLNNFFTELPENEFLLSQRVWYSQLMKSERFVEYVISRYHKLRKRVLSEEYLMEYAKDVEKWLGTSINRNFDKWGYSFDVAQLSIYEKKRPLRNIEDTTEEELNPSNYQEAMEWMLEYMEERGQWMDENINSLRQYYHPSKNAATSLK